MKVWITKYALTDGIIEADAEVGGFDTITATWDNGTRCDNFKSTATWDNGTRCDNFKSEEWWNQKKNAIEKAEEMRQKKIAGLKKQIEKLERMRFE